MFILSFLIVVIRAFFSLGKPGQNFINFIDRFRESAFGLIDFLYWFPVFNFIHFCSPFFFLFFTLGLYCSSSSSFLRWDLDIFFFSNLCFQCYKISLQHSVYWITHILLSSIFTFMQFKIFKHFSWNFFGPYYIWEVCCWLSIILEFFPAIFLLFFTLIPFWSKSILFMISGF